MYVIREVLQCRPGKVRPMIDKFKAISDVLTGMGHQPLRVLTDAAGGSFWTIVAEASVEKLDDFFAVEQALTTDESVRKTMADYHELVHGGHREVYRLES